MPAARALIATVVLTTAACAELGGLGALVQPPRFEQDDAQPAEIRVAGPSINRPLGGATVRIWTKVTNPNTFGFTLGTLKGNLFLEGTRAAEADFPLGLPLAARQETVIPLDLSISFSDLPGLADVIRRAASGDSIAYRLDGTVGVDAGRFGQPIFGPMTLLRGDVRRR
jgi:Late embryogenesis abundant protein